jgi:ABC-type thiamin/hydroxymethylpyrimidine transport system permease subunit
MTTLGLLLILLSWILQFLSFKQKEKINLFAMLSYSAGTAFLVMESFMTGDFAHGSLYLLTLCVVMLIIMQFKHPYKSR